MCVQQRERTHVRDQASGEREGLFWKAVSSGFKVSTCIFLMPPTHLCIFPPPAPHSQVLYSEKLNWVKIGRGKGAMSRTDMYLCEKICLSRCETNSSLNSESSKGGYKENWVKSSFPFCHQRHDAVTRMFTREMLASDS